MVSALTVEFSGRIEDGKPARARRSAATVPA